MTKSDLLDYTENRINGIPEGKRIKRWGRDKNDVYWAIGKVHGLENIAYLSQEELDRIGDDPVALQEALNRVEPQSRGNQSYEEYFQKTLQVLDEYKQEVNKHNFAGSDRKKVLAMPFALVKRRELPEPKKGQDEWKIFEELTGKAWDHYDGVIFDPETKITEFEYEKFIPPQILKTMDTDSQEFKNYVKLKHLTSQTEMEKHKSNQESFKSLMPHLAGLSKQEKEDLIHQFQNTKETRWSLLEKMVDKRVEKKLAKVQEEEAYLAKNRYRLDNETIRYADKARMPVDKKKLRYVLRQRTNALRAILQEVPNYEEHRKLYDANKESTYVAHLVDRADGEKKDFFKDIGLFANQMPYYGDSELQVKMEETRENDTDLNYENMINGVFTELDMTDYQDTMLYNDVAEDRHEKEYRHPSEYDYESIDYAMEKPKSGLQELEMIDEPIQYVASEAHRAYLEDKALEALEAEAAAEEEEEDDDEDEEGDGEEGAEDEEDYGDEYGEEDPDEIDPLHADIPLSKEDNFLEINQELSDKFNQVELEAFMKLMGVRPTKDWRDNTITQLWLEQHVYEDEHQERDPYFHMFGEIQRKDTEEYNTKLWREGSEVKFEFHEKKPARREYRF